MLTNYYDVLGVSSISSQQDIKKSFRRRAKELHPDTTAANDDADIRLLLKAYEILSDPVKRRDYDRKLSMMPNPKYRFDYREFLRSRKNDPVSQSKLIFYDLLHSHDEDALSLWEALQGDRGFDLENHLDREDFMDCAFLLAEQLEKRGQFVSAYRLLRSIVVSELRRPYFRHFFDEVVNRLRILTCFKMPGAITDEMILAFLKELVEFDFSRKDTAFFLKKIAEIYSEKGLNDHAAAFLRKGLSLDRKLAGVKKLKQKIGYAD